MIYFAGQVSLRRHSSSAGSTRHSWSSKLTRLALAIFLSLIRANTARFRAWCARSRGSVCCRLLTGLRRISAVMGPRVMARMRTREAIVRTGAMMKASVREVRVRARVMCHLSMLVGNTALQYRTEYRHHMVVAGRPIPRFDRFISCPKVSTVLTT